MKLWHFALGAVVLGIVYVMVTRPTVTNPVASGTNANTSNSWLGALVTAGAGALGKLGGASPAVQTNNVGVSPGLALQGNQIVNSNGQVQSYGPPDPGPDPSVNQ